MNPYEQLRRMEKASKLSLELRKHSATEEMIRAMDAAGCKSVAKAAGCKPPSDNRTVEEVVKMMFGDPVAAVEPRW